MNWIQKYFQRPKTGTHSSSKFNLYKQYPDLWHLTLNSVARGVAIGLFTACTPFVPFQTLIVITLSILFRANLPIAFAVSWVSNPLTLLPMTYFTYCVGNWALGGGAQENIVIHDYSWYFHNRDSLPHSFSIWIQQFGKAFFIGLPIVALTSALIGYCIVILVWHGVKFYQQRRGGPRA